MEAQTASLPSPWPARRRRAERLRERHPFAAEVLTLYLSLLDVQEPAFEAALARPPAVEAVPRLALELLPRVVAAAVAAGPPLLASAVAGRHPGDAGDDLVGRWLRGEEQAPVDGFLARAAAAPFLEALPDAPVSLPPPQAGGEGERVGARCPRCGGLPQLSYAAAAGEALVTGPRRLVCARCAAEWIFSRMVCAGCGEETSGRLPIYSEAELFPHLRIDGCETCHRYLIGVDLRRDAAAVPVVDELAALPLHLYAQEHGLSKVVPNLMGF